jgi:alpha-galactosidase
MTKVAIIGAGSTVFTTELVTDILLAPKIPPGTFALVDIDAERLELAHKMAEHLISQTGEEWEVISSTDREDVIADCDYVINTIEVAGLANVRHDFEIPIKYGVNQCIGDTIGPGGIFKALRTLPAWLVMNYTNPMSLTVLTGLRGSSLPIVGLCHSIQHTAQQLAGYLGIPFDQVDFRAAGVNHLAWITELTRNEEDLYPLLFERARNPAIYEQDPVRFEMMFHLGAFVTESSGHSSEYVPYFRKRDDLIEKFCREGYLGETGFYANNWPRWREENDAYLRRVLAGEKQIDFERGPEFASYIIESMATNVPTVIYGNVLNTGLIENLPQDGVVEVACLVDRRGVQPTYFGALPTQLAGLCQQHMAVHDLVATAVLGEDREAAFHALALDPLTAAACSLDEIRQMFDEMVTVQQAYLPEFLHG